MGLDNEANTPPFFADVYKERTQEEKRQRVAR